MRVLLDISGKTIGFGDDDSWLDNPNAYQAPDFIEVSNYYYFQCTNVNDISNPNSWVMLEPPVNQTLIEQGWSTGVYVSRGEYYKYNGIIYSVIQSHTTQAGYEPDATPALFYPLPVRKEGELYPSWRQPLGSEDAYKAGEKVTHNNKNWSSNVDANVWEPGVSQWTDLDAVSAPNWVQPVGAQDAYQLGDHVMHNSVEWVSDYNNNVWEPGVFGWTQIS